MITIISTKKCMLVFQAIKDEDDEQQYDDIMSLGDEDEGEEPEFEGEEPEFEGEKPEFEGIDSDYDADDKSMLQQKPGFDMVPEVKVPDNVKANPQDPLNRLVWKYREMREQDPDYAKELMGYIMMDASATRGETLNDYTERVYQEITKDEGNVKTAWEVFLETKLLDNWDGSKGNFFGYYNNTIKHDAAREKSRADASRAGFDMDEWEKDWQITQYLRQYINGMDRQDRDVIPPHIMDLERYSESNQIPPGWDQKEWQKYLDSLAVRFSKKYRGKMEGLEAKANPKDWTDVKRMRKKVKKDVTKVTQGIDPKRVSNFYNAVFNNWKETGSYSAPTANDFNQWIETGEYTGQKKEGGYEELRLTDDEKIFESTFWDRHDFKRPGRTEDAIQYWNECRDKLVSLIKTNPEIWAELERKLPETVVTPSTVMEKKKGKEMVTDVPDDIVLFNVDDIPPRGSLAPDLRSSVESKRSFSKLMDLFKTVSKDYPELAQKSGIDENLMFRKPEQKIPGTNEENQDYPGKYYLLFDMVAPFRRQYASKKMLDIQRAYMHNVAKTIPLSSLMTPEGTQVQFQDQSSYTPEDIAISREEEGLSSTEKWLRENEDMIASVRNRLIKMAERNASIRKAVETC